MPATRSGRSKGRISTRPLSVTNSCGSSLTSLVDSEEGADDNDTSDSDSPSPCKRHKVASKVPRPPVSKARAIVSRSNKSTLFKTIEVNGQVLQPTVAFDAFWTWAHERMVIDSKRRSGLPPPWTDDIILRDYYFCNPFRVADRVTQFLITDVIEKGSQAINEVVFRVCIFSIFTKPETWDSLEAALGPISWSKYNRDAYREALENIANSGRSLYTGAYQKPAFKYNSDAPTYMNHIILVEMWMEQDFPKRLKSAEYLLNVFEWLISFPGMGEFNTYQLLLNLTYTSVVHFSNNDFVVAGIGAKSGLIKLFGQSYKNAQANVPNIDDEIMRWMVDHQQNCFQKLGIDFIGLGPKRLPLELPDIEHTICEVDKYCRAAFPQIKGRDSRTNMRRTYTFSGKPLPPLRLPKAWSHPARRRLRVRSIPPIIEKRYIISAIKDQEYRDGVLGYNVVWLGYSGTTWEPEEGLLLDAPSLVLDYRARGNGGRINYLPSKE